MEREILVRGVLLAAARLNQEALAASKFTFSCSQPDFHSIGRRIND